jgi:hypothetical protein
MLRLCDDVPTMTDRPRDAAMSMNLAEGSGPIVCMVSDGDVLEVYKVDRCFEVLTPDNVDPGQKDPNAPWIIKHVSAYGSGKDVVARTVLQAYSFLHEATFKAIVNKDKILQSAKQCRASLIECEKLSSQIDSEIDRIVLEYQRPKTTRNVIEAFPTYEGLREVVGTFLLHAKQALQGGVGIVNSFFGQSFSGPVYHKLREWAKAEFPETGFPDFLADHEPRAKWIVDLRNFYEHPDHMVGEIRDFFWEPETRKIHLPTWSVSGSKPSAIAKDIGVIVGLLLDLVEGLIVFSAMIQVDTFPYILVKNEPLKPEIPVRFSLKIDPSMLSGSQDHEPNRR